MTLGETCGMQINILFRNNFEPLFILIIMGILRFIKTQILLKLYIFFTPFMVENTIYCGLCVNLIV